jgi:hypothetical protein
MPAFAQPVAVDITNASEPTLCAEKDNVYLKLMSPDVRRFTITAEQPAYSGTIVVDRSENDFRNCDMSRDPVYPATPRRVIVFENEQWQLIGHTFPSFWRASDVRVRVGDRVESGLHLLQLWTRHKERTEEVLVLYPADGYWRARPLTPPHLRWNVYGSSFLIGPIETQGRPLVDITEIVFEPDAKSLRLAFRRGGTAVLRVIEVNEEHIVTEVTFDHAPGAQFPFAALRSMYVTETNADAARVAWRESGAEAWREQPVMQFENARAVELWLGRRTPSRHNLSAPDMVIGGFSATP